jgi:hypothetical protein
MLVQHKGSGERMLRFFALLTLLRSHELRYVFNAG